jgi:predicted kinase
VQQTVPMDAVPPTLVLVTGLPGTGKSTIADAVASRIRAAVLAHDWAMSGLQRFPAIQQVLDAMDPPRHRAVGWSILLALARAQLRRRTPVVLDGVARAPEIQLCRAVAVEESARLIVIQTECPDVVIHRSRIAGRRREIPNWYELDWDHVQRARDGWVPITDADLTLSATNPLDANLGRLGSLIDALMPGDETARGPLSPPDPADRSDRRE